PNSNNEPRRCIVPYCEKRFLGAPAARRPRHAGTAATPARRDAGAPRNSTRCAPNLDRHSNDDPVSARFTIDGGDKLEEQLSALCRCVCDGVRAIVPGRTLEAIVLGGGYGRGEGGVLLTSEGDKPYNDIEFYLFIKGSALMNQRRYGEGLNRLADDLSGDAGLH